MIKRNQVQRVFMIINKSLYWQQQPLVQRDLFQSLRNKIYWELDDTMGSIRDFIFRELNG
jgi:hypothetical protein